MKLVYCSTATLSHLRVALESLDRDEATQALLPKVTGAVAAVLESFDREEAAHLLRSRISVAVGAVLHTAQARGDIRDESGGLVGPLEIEVDEARLLHGDLSLRFWLLRPATEIPETVRHPGKPGPSTHAEVYLVERR